jgi:hypothetical protein
LSCPPAPIGSRETTVILTGKIEPVKRPQRLVAGQKARQAEFRGAETRGGTLIVFADPMWPKIQTLVFTFSGLSNDQTQQLLAFLDAHLGEEVGVYDWEHRYWKGVITTPSEPVVQDGRDSFSASLEFEGELVPA